MVCPLVIEAALDSHLKQIAVILSCDLHGELICSVTLHVTEDWGGKSVSFKIAVVLLPAFGNANGRFDE